ncbi:tapasin-related protein isoform X2 [Oxyura jamaicensis]|uniref:tapasin-related protein isoform X2 n=1 Tax=Oxyura jamaicensis TaxID=8884 RepID=UPI0015A68B1A|nr:tapasin-related protein isoform X2 [Oxyura jamaicensis]
MIRELILCCCVLALHAGPTEDPTAAPQFRRVDIVLGCSYVWDGGSLHGFGGSLSEHPATLVLRGISVRDDGSLGDVTDYEVPRGNPDSSPPVVFEASAQSVSVPHAEALLHMDCNGEEVSCELSLYSSRRDGEGPCRASWFMATLRLSSGISIALVLRGPCPGGQEEEGHDAVLHPKLRIPMSKEGMLLTTEPPRVRVLPSVVSFESDETITLSCIISGYYPLDVSVSWTQRSPEHEAEIRLSDTRFSSHRQNQDGTYSITSYLSLSSATAQAPVTYTCHVSHVALEEPISVSALLKEPEHKGWEGLMGVLIATAIFIAVLFAVLRRKRAAKPKSEQLLTVSE